MSDGTFSSAAIADVGEAVAAFLIDKRGKTLFARFVQQLVNGATQADAFRDVYGTDPQTFADEFLARAARSARGNEQVRIAEKSQGHDGRRDCDRRRRDRTVGRARTGGAGGCRHRARAGRLWPRGELGRCGDPAARQSRRRGRARVAAACSESFPLARLGRSRSTAETGIETGYARCGGLELRSGTEENVDDLSTEIEWWRGQGVRVEELDSDALKELEPLVSPEIVAAYRLPELGQVRNPRLLKALLAGCACARRTTPCGDAGQSAWKSRARRVRKTKGARIDSLRTHSGSVQAGRYLVTGGAWSRGLLASVGVDVAINPVRGQMVLLVAIAADVLTRSADRLAIHCAARRRKDLDRLDRGARRFRQSEHGVGGERALGLRRQPGAGARPCAV